MALNEVILHQFLNEGDNIVGVIAAAAVYLGQPAPGREQEGEHDVARVSNNNYFKLIVPNYNLNDFKEHFRMSRGTFQVGTYLL